MLFKKKKNTGVGKIIVGDKSFEGKAEGYDRLKDNVLYLNADGNNKVIQIASSVAHEGKTTVISNLAVSLGLTDKKVVVVDTDFRRPRLHHRFGKKMEGGLSEYVLGTMAKEEIIKPTDYKNVDIVTRGAKVYNPSLVLVSDKFKNFIKELRETYDYVLIDCAPVLSVSDYIHVLSVSDGVLFLVAYGQTTRNQVADAVKELKQNKANILGSVFTMYNKKRDNYYHGYGHGYYYSYYKYYRDEGNDESTEEKTEEKEQAKDKE